MSDNRETGLGTNALFSTQAEKQDSPQLARKPKKRRKHQRKTYLMTDELIERIEAAAESYGVPVNEFHRYLCIVALDAIEGGNHEVEATPKTTYTLGV